MKIRPTPTAVIHPTKKEGGLKPTATATHPRPTPPSKGGGLKPTPTAVVGPDKKSGKGGGLQPTATATHPRPVPPSSGDGFVHPTPTAVIRKGDK